MADMVVVLGFTLTGPLCTATGQSGASWSKAELIQRARAGALLENMASRIRANSEHAEEYVGKGIGAGSVESCDSAASVAELDVCEWGNLLRTAAQARDAEYMEGLQGARGCISSPKPSTYVISIAWDGAVLTTPPGASCDVTDFRGESQRRALLTVVRVAQDS